MGSSAQTSRSPQQKHSGRSGVYKLAEGNNTSSDVPVTAARYSAARAAAADLGSQRVLYSSSGGNRYASAKLAKWPRVRVSLEKLPQTNTLIRKL